MIVKSLHRSAEISRKKKKQLQICKVKAKSAKGTKMKSAIIYMNAIPNFFDNVHVHMCGENLNAKILGVAGFNYKYVFLI